MIPGMAWLDALQPELARIAGACHDDPHALLGAHMRDGRQTVLTFLPAVSRAWLPGGRALTRLAGTDFFGWQGPAGDLPEHYPVNWIDSDGAEQTRIDPYSFAPTISAEDLWGFGEGSHVTAWRFLGAHPMRLEGI